MLFCLHRYLFLWLWQVLVACRTFTAHAGPLLASEAFPLVSRVPAQSCVGRAHSFKVVSSGLLFPSLLTPTPLVKAVEDKVRSEKACFYLLYVKFPYRTSFWWGESRGAPSGWCDHSSRTADELTPLAVRGQNPRMAGELPRVSFLFLKWCCIVWTQSHV